MRSAEDLIDSVVNSSHIPPRKRSEIQRELRAHIEDFVLAARAAGRDQDQIEQLVLTNFGDPGQIARGFAWVYRRERRTLRLVAYVLSSVLLASSLLAAILAMQAGLALGFGTSIAHVLASRHTLIEALDILTSVAAYLGLTALENSFQTRRFEKAAVFLMAILTVLMASCAAAGLHANFLVFGVVNGLFFRAIQIFLSRKIARIAIVMICFPLVGIGLALLRSPVSEVAFAMTCASWLIMGLGYELMTHLAARVDMALLNSLQRGPAS